jgi:hypothetical protein
MKRMKKEDDNMKKTKAEMEKISLTPEEIDIIATKISRSIEISYTGEPSISFPLLTKKGVGMSCDIFDCNGKTTFGKFECKGHFSCGKFTCTGQDQYKP